MLLRIYYKNIFVKKHTKRKVGVFRCDNRKCENQFEREKCSLLRTTNSTPKFIWGLNWSIIKI